jgi:hypothetical protein
MVVALGGNRFQKGARGSTRSGCGTRDDTIRFDPEFTSTTCPAVPPSKAASVVLACGIQSCKTILESIRTDDRLLVRRDPAPAKDSVREEAAPKCRCPLRLDMVGPLCLHYAYIVLVRQLEHSI